MDSQDMCRCYREHEDELNEERPKMDESKKEELKKLLVSQSRDQA
ncbi:hypothetical protein [Coraliomargarita sinensis]|nr:hypothetical protein [Coraliomargarita sinensis]